MLDITSITDINLSQALIVRVQKNSLLKQF